MVERLTEDNFILHAMHWYDNPQCQTLKEFEEDVKRFIYIGKLFDRYFQNNDLKERLILNHIIILYNVFGVKATNMLFFKLEPAYWSCLKSFLIYLGRMPDELPEIDVNAGIVSDSCVTKVLEDL